MSTGSPAVARRVNRERIVLLGWGRAILLQVAHPLVAAGVADHTDFRTGPLDRLRRLRNTVRAMLAFTFGPPDAAAHAARTINAIHDRVNGRLRHAVGPFPAGTPYSARDPRLLTWVHATVVDSSLLVYERLVERLDPRERDRYWADASGMAPFLEIPEGYLPTSADAGREYLEGMVRSGTLTVGPAARRLSQDLLWFPRSPDRPLQWLLRLFSVGLLPESIRAGYGFRWGRRHEAGLRAAEAALRGLLALAPGFVRHWKQARGP